MEMAGVGSHVGITRPAVYRGESSRTSEADEARLAVTDPALQVVTDFVLEQPATVPADHSIDEALREMIRAGVRALLVVRDEVVTGLITSYDIQGERPLQFLAESGYRRHDEIEVGHIMTPWERVTTLDWQALGRARVADLVAFFRATAATHVVVSEFRDQGGTVVRGLISRTRLERRLGHSI
jgi:CBS domain containing-hemolysin-like protein